MEEPTTRKQIQAFFTELFKPQGGIHKTDSFVGKSENNKKIQLKVLMLSKLENIEQLSPSDIKQIFAMPMPLFDSAYFVFCELASGLSPFPKILQALVDYAFNRLRAGDFISHGSKDEIPDAILFFGIDKLLEDYSTFGWFRRWRFNSSTNAVVKATLVRIAEELLIENDPELWDRLNKFTPAVIKRALTIKYLGETLFSQFSRENFSGYNNIKIAMDDLKIASFDAALNNKKLTVFQSELAKIEDQENEVEKLQILISRIVDRIGTSRFQGKYEDMMEQCLFRLKKLSDHKKGLNLEKEVLGKCLNIVNKYFFKSNTAKFFNYDREHGYSMLSYTRGNSNSKISESVRPMGGKGKEEEVVDVEIEDVQGSQNVQKKSVSDSALIQKVTEIESGSPVHSRRRSQGDLPLPAAIPQSTSPRKNNG